MSLLQRARESGRCPPSFLNEQNMSNEDGFENEMMEIVAGTSGTIFYAFVGVKRIRENLVSNPFSFIFQQD